MTAEGRLLPTDPARPAAGIDHPAAAQQRSLDRSLLAASSC